MEEAVAGYCARSSRLWAACSTCALPRPLLQGCQADPLAEQQDWQHGLLAALPAARPTSPPPLEHVSALIVQVYAHHVRQLPLTGPTEPW